MFVYFIPDRQTLELADLRALGLGYAFDRPGFSFGRIANGPGDQAGILVSRGDRLGYRPGEQTWRRVPGSPAHVGYTTADPPAPESLLRDSALPGRPVELGDGRQWLIPVVRSWRGDEDSAGWVLQLPAAVDCDDEGQWIASQPVAQHGDIYRGCIEYFELKAALIRKAAQDAQEADDEPGSKVRRTFTFDHLFELALALLRTNYRVDKAEVSLLHLLTTVVAVRIVETAIDWQTMEAWLEKKTPTTSTPTGGGSKVYHPPTAQR